MSNEHFRCGICNCVSSEEIATNQDDFKGRTTFVPDTKNPLHFVCLDCSEATGEVLSDWDFMDEETYWENFDDDFEDYCEQE